MQLQKILKLQKKNMFIQDSFIFNHNKNVQQTISNIKKRKKNPPATQYGTEGGVL